MPGVGLRQRGVIPKRPMSPDPGHPLAAGLVFAQFSGNNQGRAGGTGMSFTQSLYGRASATSNTQSGFATPLRNRWGSMANWTMHTVTRCVGHGIYATSFEVPHNPTSATWDPPYHAFCMTLDTFSTVPGVGTNAGGSFTSAFGTGTYWLTDGAWHSYTASWGTQGAIWWRDGVQFATSASTPNGSSALDPASSGSLETVFGCRSVSTADEGYEGTGVLMFLWSRRLSDKEVAMAHADPFEMFRDGR